MDLCEGGPLLERITSGHYSERYIARQVRSILRFISQCHAKGIIYRDTKVRWGSMSLQHGVECAWEVS